MRFLDFRVVTEEDGDVGGDVQDSDLCVVFVRFEGVAGDGVEG